MKKFILFVLFVSVVAILYINRNDITEYCLINFVYKGDFDYSQTNEYTKQDFEYFKTTDKFMPENKKDILNIIFTAVNHGYDSFNFFCSYKYKDCVNDVKEIVQNSDQLAYINNFVAPYNTYSKLNITMNNFGKITVDVDKYYPKTLQEKINKKVDDIMSQTTYLTMNDHDKILAIHDYIIDHSIYDKEKEEYLNTDVMTSFNSDLAIGPLFQGHGICSGYSDAFSIFLDKLNIPNYRISNDEHIWNFVYLDGKWQHIDITWDDPLISNGSQIISHDYFLISTNDLYNLDLEKHEFNEDVFLEAKKA